MNARLGAAVGAALLLALAPPGPVGAQIGQFRLTGSIDQDVSVDNLRTGSQSFQTFSYGSRYAPNLDGFVLDPRLLTFSFSGAFADQETSATSGDTRALNIEPYRLAVTALPFGLNSLTLRAARTTSDFDFERGQISTTTDSKGGRWTFRGTEALPEASLDFNRETVNERLFTGSSERTRSTLALTARRSFDRFQPRIGYTAELRESSGSLGSGFARDGLVHQAQYDDRIRLGERAVLTPLIGLEIGPDRHEGNANLTLASPLSPTVDGSAGLRYSVFGQDSFANHTAAFEGQLIDRFSPDLVLTGIGNATYVTGTGADAWGAGGLLALRATPFTHLASVGDYGLQLSGGERGTTVSHRGHVNAVSTILPRHIISGDYFVTVTQTEAPGGSFSSHSASLEVTSSVIPLTTATARYALELQQGGSGDHQRQSWRLGAEWRPLPALSSQAGVTYFTEEGSGGGQASREEHGFVSDAGVSVRATEWLDLVVTGRYGRKEVSREDRVGSVDLLGITGSAGLTLGGFVFRGEGFAERDEDARQERLGMRGSLLFRFRVWTVTAEFEVSRLRNQGIDVARDRLSLRITRPLNLTWP
jgi:hypothetical protein